MKMFVMVCMDDTAVLTAQGLEAASVCYLLPQCLMVCRAIAVRMKPLLHGFYAGIFQKSGGSVKGKNRYVEPGFKPLAQKERAHGPSGEIRG